MLGSTVSTVGGLPLGFRNADILGCECVQMYVTPSRTWSVPELTREARIAFIEAWKGSDVKAVISHTPLIVNLASSDTEIRDKSVSRLIVEIERAENLGIEYIVLHPGSNQEKAKGILLIVEALSQALESTEESPVSILLETAAGQGNSIGSTLEEIALIMSSLSNHKRIGVCLDTCHLLASGYDLRGYEGCGMILNYIDRILGLSRIKAIHINDSANPVASRKDRHAGIGEGFVGLQAFHALVREKRLAGVPKILELPEHLIRGSLGALRRLRQKRGRIANTWPIRSNTADMEQKC